MAGLLDALLANESGGRNVVQGNIGDINNRTGDLAKGYFQITGSTWRDFGGTKYAPDPLGATYEQQAEIAANIPLGRWGPNTITAMRATGKPIDTSRTLGENLAMNGEGFSGAVATTAAAGGSDGSRPPPPPPLPDDLFAAAAEVPRSHLAETLSSRVGQRSGGRQQPAFDSGVPPSPPIEFAKATPELATNSPALVAPPVSAETPDSGLASLFKVKDIGGAGKIDPVTGLPLLPRPRWA